MIGKNSFRMPAEWEPQEAVQLTWPHAATDWAPMLDEITAVYRRMALEISKRERLIVVAPANAAHDCLRITCPTNDTWARDHGFISLIDDDGHRRLLDFRFDGWGGKYPSDLDNAINRRLYDVGELEGEYVDCLDFVLEGGSIESDGRGTIFTTTSCLMDSHRRLGHGDASPSKASLPSQADVEAELKARLCAERVLWIDHGHLAGDDTDGHIDTLVRVCPNDTLLYIGCDDPNDEHFDDLKAMEAQLRTFRTLDGRPYRLRRLPLPRPIFDDDGQEASADTPHHPGSRLPATYANFLVINDAVLCPTYGQPDLDAEAISIIGEAFPGRETVAIDCRPVIRQHGSLHCCTMQFPKI